jgi:hypothetical protein
MESDRLDLQEHNMTNQHHNNAHKNDSGISDLLGSVVGLATAGTRFTLKQMQNAMGVFTEPQAVINNVRESLDNISHAMTKPIEEAASHSPGEPQSAQDAFTGRKL